ncbi:hypothetical protein LS684_14345 [Cytobacillus spongiae]|jgi:competence protein ComGG|uniref:competence type IV pilus minor pilin ComGG n=1 Tax=Cytobacillus spongiae TaxID=2901381 RepID=UPI001EECC752|nr:competence type IV pilus minor pilin ComGG [Cytobacillus spongiae]UII54831.1 hypothetical protein LS684_14345 [Cytobacillus spongiae]
MRVNEKGMIYPITYSLLIVVSFFLLIVTEQYVTEKKILAENKQLLKQEYYMLCSVREMEKILQNGAASSSGELHFHDGVVQYEQVAITSALTQVTFKLYLEANMEILGFGYYDQDLKKMIKWVEK